MDKLPSDLTWTADGEVRWGPVEFHRSKQREWRGCHGFGHSAFRPSRCCLGGSGDAERTPNIQLKLATVGVQSRQLE